MNYKDSLDFVNSFINHEKTNAVYPQAFKLDRMRALMKELGNPQNAYDSMIVAGSKGKGSVCSILSSILRMDNYKVGLYTSPHLDVLRERIQVNGLMISENRFADAASLLRRSLDAYEWRKNPPTYFEILTAIAFYHFREMKIHVAVLEVGLGGLYDSTNIVHAKIVGLTPISLEHTDKLGKTPAKIAVQKCGVIKGREWVVSAPQVAEVDAIIQKSCDENEAQLWRVGKDVRIIEREYDEKSQRFDLKTIYGSYYNLDLKLLGKHQLDNAAVAVGMAKGLEAKTRHKVSESAIRQGIGGAQWPGRMEQVKQHPRVILDGSQNADSAKKLIQALKRHFHFEKIILVLGLMEDKDLDGIIFSK